MNGADLRDVTLYRRRFMPDEKILLKDDIIISLDDERLVTKWNVLTKRHDFSHGVSCYFFNQGWKISRFLNDRDELVYWYCDIIDTEYSEADNAYTLNDLLADVIIYPDGRVQVVDVDELAQALRDELVPKELVIKALDRLDSLLRVIYEGEFEKYSAYVTEV